VVTKSFTDKLVQECWKLIHERGYVEIAPTTFQKNRKLLPDGRRSLDGFYLGIYVRPVNGDFKL